MCIRLSIAFIMSSSLYILHPPLTTCLMFRQTHWSLSSVLLFREVHKICVYIFFPRLLHGKRKGFFHLRYS